MKSIERRFRDLEEKRPYHGSVINFNATVKGMRFSRATIAKWFKKLADKEEYEKSDTRQLIKYAFSLSWPEEPVKKGKFRVRGPRIRPPKV